MKLLTIVAGVLATFLAPIKGLLILMVLFLGLDTLSGIYVAYKKYGWDGFKSHNFFNAVVKSFFYLATIIMAFWADIHLLEGSLFDIKLFLAKSITVVWCYTEIKSIDENSQKLGNKSFWEIIQEVINKLKGFKKDLNEFKSDKEEENKEE